MMTSKPRSDFSMNPSARDQQDKAKGSVFDRLGAKQTMSQHHQQPPHYPMRSKYDTDARRKLDSVQQHSSHRHNYNYHDNQYAQESNQHHIQPDDNYYKSDRINHLHVPSRHMIKSKINKEDYHDNSQYKRHHNEQHAEALEEQRIELKRELQKIDQRNPDVSKHHQNTGKSSSSRRNYKTSPCSSSSDSCSSSGSGSESGSESYTSCSSSCSSSSFSDENVHRKKNYKKSISNSTNQLHQRTDKFANTSSSNLMRGHTPPPIHQQSQQHLNRNIPNKRYHQTVDLNAAKRLRSRSPQSTTSSYYSRQSNRAGPLTPPLPNSSHHSQHSLSNSNTPSSSINKLDMSSNSNVKFDRHGNVRVSLIDKERQRKENYDVKQPPQQINSPSSVNNYSKSSRSPLSRSREDLYPSYVSSSEKRKFTPSPIHHRHQQSVSPFSPHINRNKPPQQHPQHDYQMNHNNSYNKMYDNRSSLNSSFHGHGYKQQHQPPPSHQLPHHQSAPSLRQNLNPLSHRGSPVFNYDNNSYRSPVRDHPHYSPRPPIQQFHKVKEFDNRNPNYNNRYMDYKGHSPSSSHPLNRNNLNSNNKNLNYSPLRTSSSLSNTHHYPIEQQQHLPFKKQPNFNNNNNNNQQPHQQFTNVKPINQKQQNLQNLKHQLVQKQQQQQVNKPPKTKQDDQGDEISSISNNSITEDIIEDIIEDDVQHTKILKDEENAKKEKELKSNTEKAKVNDKEDDQIEDGEMKDDDDDEEEEGLIVEKTDDIKKVEHLTENIKGDKDQNKKHSKIVTETTVGSTTKNDESGNAFSDENFSEGSDVDDYGNNAADSTNLNNTEDDKLTAENKVDNYDDVKFKIDELEAISDEEFDAIIDEHLENGMLSCKQVLDQLDINWASLIRDKDLDKSQEEKDKKQEQKSKEASAKSNFKSAQLLSQLGISNKFTGSDLRKLIESYCCSQLNDNNFNLESSLVKLQSLEIKKKRLNDGLPPNSQNTKLELLNDAESKSTPTDINRKMKIISFNHLVQNLKSKLNANSSSNQDNASRNGKPNEEIKSNQEINVSENINSESLTKDELIA